jgi:hypothetical protein
MSLEPLEQIGTDANFEFDPYLRVVLTKAAQDLRQPAGGQILTGTDSQPPGMVAAR